MKRFSLLLALFVAYGGMQAQEAEESDATADPMADEATMEYSEPYVIGVGAQIGIVGGGIALENSEGRKVNPAFNLLPTYGAVVYAPFGVDSKAWRST